MIEKERFLILWNALVENYSVSTGASEDKSPMTISNGVSNVLKQFLLSNANEDGLVAAEIGKPEDA